MRAQVHTDELVGKDDKLEHESQVIKYARSNNMHDKNCHILTSQCAQASI